MNTKSFFEVVNRVLKENGQTQEDLSRKTGIPVATLKNFVYYKYGISMDNTMKILNALGYEFVIRKKRREETR